METINDIVREMRKRFEPYAKSDSNDARYVAYLGYAEFADRIEAAVKHQFRDATKTMPHEEVAVAKIETTTPTTEKSSQVGNVAAMREALVQCELFLGNVSRHGHPTLNPGDKCTACAGVDELRGMVVRALAVPPRNCDVGTAEEQAEGYQIFCHKYPRCFGCPCAGRVKYGQCEFAWSQMPYESEVRDEN